MMVRLVIGLSLVFGGTIAWAGEVGRSAAPDGAISVRKEKQFHALAKNAPLKRDEALLLDPDAEILSASGNSSIIARGDFAEKSPLPILETILIPHPLRANDDADFDGTLESGRIDFVNRKSSGVVRFRIRFHHETWTIALDKPDSRVALVVAGRWAPGTRYLKNPPKGHEPIRTATLLVLSGSAWVGNGQTTIAMNAPPGPAALHWTSLSEPGRISAEKTESLPQWGISNTPAEFQTALEKFRTLQRENADKALDTFLTSTSTSERRVGLSIAVARDDLKRLATSVAETKDAATWDFGIRAIRHWMGRSAGREQELHKFLIDTGKFSAAQADVTIGLLNGFSETECDEPETYELLIEYLKHENGSIRKLAAWQLTRLVPRGVPFDPAADAAAFEQMYKKWKILVPTGKLPPGRAR